MFRLIAAIFRLLQFCLPEKGYRVMTKCSGRSLGQRVAKRKGLVMNRERPRGSCGKKALNRQIFIVGYLQFVKRKHLHSVVCSTGFEPQSVSRKWHRRMSMSGAATFRKIDFAVSSGSSQEDGHDV